VSDGSGKKVASGLGVLGAVALFISVWWFALRPRRHGEDS
jgi:hypothetical protein